MSLIDWSDPDEMLGLLVEYVGDEATGESEDRGRAEFLRALRRELERVERMEFAAVDEMVAAVREVGDAQPREFEHDRVMTHLEQCVEELERIGDRGCR